MVYGSKIHGMVEVCEGAPVAVGGWVLTDRHDLAPCATNSPRLLDAVAHGRAPSCLALSTLPCLHICLGPKACSRASRFYLFLGC